MSVARRTSVILGGVHVDYLGADEYDVHTKDTRASVHTSSSKVAMSIGRAVAVAEGLIGGTLGAPSECPVCLSVRVCVTDSRTVREAVRRRRRCKACGARWTTEERVMTIDPSRTRATP